MGAGRPGGGRGAPTAGPSPIAMSDGLNCGGIAPPGGKGRRPPGPTIPGISPIGTPGGGAKPPLNLGSPTMGVRALGCGGSCNPNCPDSQLFGMILSFLMLRYFELSASLHSLGRFYLGLKCQDRLFFIAWRWSRIRVVPTRMAWRRKWAWRRKHGWCWGLGTWG